MKLIYTITHTREIKTLKYYPSWVKTIQDAAEFQTKMLALGYVEVFDDLGVEGTTVTTVVGE